MRNETDEANLLAKKLTEIKVDSYKEYSSAKFFNGHKFLISNESYLHNKLPEKLEALKDKTANKIPIAIILGEGHVLSLLSILIRKIRLVIFYDVNPVFLAHLKIVVESVKTSRDIAEFYENYLREFKKQFGFDEGVKSNLDVLRARSVFGVGEMSFLYDEERFTLCKENLEKIEIAYFCANLLNLEHMQILTECLGKSDYTCSIELLNITNLCEYCKEEPEKSQLQSSVNLLTRFNRSKGEANPIILYSGLYQGTLIEALLAMGLNARYVAQATQNAEIEQMEIAQHPSLQYDPFDENVSPVDRANSLVSLTNFFLPKFSDTPQTDPNLPPKKLF